MRKVTDVDPIRIKQSPDKSIVLLTNGNVKDQGSIVEHIEIRQYIEKSDPVLGNYSLLTVIVKTNHGIIEMKYDEGFRGNDAFESAVAMLTHHVGFGSLINRALIELQSY
jgi:hypothetical protein